MELEVSCEDVKWIGMTQNVVLFYVSVVMVIKAV
jgi:hypothetical protein